MEPSVLITPLSVTAAKPETAPATAGEGMEYEEVDKTQSFSNRPYQNVNLLQATGLIQPRQIGMPFRRRGQCTDNKVTMNCNPRSKMRAVTPSAKLTSAVSNVVARMEPRATVTMKSKALSWLSERLPERRTRRMSRI